MRIEPVLRIAKTDRYKFVGWVPLELSQRILAGDVIQFRAVVPEANLEVEKRVFDGKTHRDRPGSIDRQSRKSGSSLKSSIRPTQSTPNLDSIQGLEGELNSIRGRSPIAEPKP